MVWVPMIPSNADKMRNESPRFLTIARLAPGASVAAATSEMNGIQRDVAVQYTDPDYRDHINSVRVDRYEAGRSGVRSRTTRPNLLFIGIVAVLIATVIGELMAMRQRRVRSVAEKGLRREISENNDGVQEMRAAIPTEVENVSHTVALLEQREAGHAVDGSQVKIGLAVMSFTNANWQTASVTGAMSSIDYDTVERFAGAYFEQARLAQLQTSTMESMMSLSSYVGHGEKLQSDWYIGSASRLRAPVAKGLYRIDRGLLRSVLGPWPHLGPAAKVRILRFKTLPSFRHYLGLQGHV